MFTRRHLLSAGAALPFVVVDFLQGASRAGAQQLTDALVDRAIKAGEKEIVIAGGTGAYGDAVKRHFLDPFAQASGIKVISAGGSYGEKLAKLKAMKQVGRVEWDVLTLSVDMLTPQNAEFFRDLGEGCGDTPNVAGAGIDGACLRHGVIFDIGAGVMAFSTDTFPDGRPQPASWADFWNVKDFPGPRALPNIGTPHWPMVAALLADGVAPAALFPLDVDRALAKLDQIKPHVGVWWRSGDQSQQIFRSKEVVMAMMFAGRALRLRADGLPIGVSWNGAPLDASFWGVLKDAPRPHAALALVNFIYSRPQAHAEFARETLSPTGLKSLLPLLDPAAQKVQATHPDNWPKIVRTDAGWLGANQEAVLKRWTEWLAR
jgi:mannopine transport system substrate-binding protein